MPSSLNLFIRIPKGFNEQDVMDAIVKKDICKVLGVSIKKGKKRNHATVLVDYWYKGTRHIRDTLVSGYPVSILVDSTIWLAYELKQKENEKHFEAYPEIDEFGRDVLRKPNNYTILRADAPVFVPKSLQNNNDLEEENKRAADDFIRKLEYELNKLVSKQCDDYNNNCKGANAPPGSHQQLYLKIYEDKTDLEEGELCETKTNNKKHYNSDKPTPNIHTEAALKRKIRFALPPKK